MRDQERSVVREVDRHEPVAMITACDLSKSFGAVRVLRRLSLSFQDGEVVLLLGANGAGKSTLLRIIAGLSRPDSGSVCGGAHSSVGFFSHHLSMYARLTVRENLDLFCRVAGSDQAELARALELWDLTDCAAKQVHELSKGTQARASLARVFMTRPSVVLLDEPTSNLDNKSVDILGRALREPSQRRCVVVATHDIHRLRDVATRVVVLERGLVAADSGLSAARPQISAVIDQYLESNR